MLAYWRRSSASTPPPFDLLGDRLRQSLGVGSRPGDVEGGLGEAEFAVHRRELAPETGEAAEVLVGVLELQGQELLSLKFGDPDVRHVTPLDGAESVGAVEDPVLVDHDPGTTGRHLLGDEDGAEPEEDDASPPGDDRFRVLVSGEPRPADDEGERAEEEAGLADRGAFELDGEGVLQSQALTMWQRDPSLCSG